MSDTRRVILRVQILDPNGGILGQASQESVVRTDLLDPTKAGPALDVLQSDFDLIAGSVAIIAYGNAFGGKTP